MTFSTQLAHCLGAAMVFAVGAVEAHAQEVVRLGPASQVADREFTLVLGVRELSDGSVITSDRREGYVYHVGFAGVRGVGEVGRPGDGPGEYRTVGRPVPSGTDSTLVFDSRRRRWVLITGAEIAGDFDRYREHQDVAGLRLVGGTNSGWLVTMKPVQDVRSISLADEIELFRLRPGLSPERLTILDGIGAAGMRQAIPGWVVVENPLVPMDQASVAESGDVAVVRHSPYRLDWFRADGTFSQGPVIEAEFPRLTRGHKCDAMVGFGGPGAECQPEVYDDWPERLPPYVTFSRVPAVYAVSGDLALVKRTTRGEAGGPVYDALDTDGARFARLELEAGAEIVAASSRWIYVVSTDEFGLQTLSRHAIPRELVRGGG